MEYIEVYNKAVSKLENIGHLEASLDAWYLMEKISGFSRADWFLRQSEAMSSSLLEEFEAMLRRLENDEPVAYILGEQEFMGLRFKVDKNVLIPRQDTEHVTELAINEAAALYRSRQRSNSGGDVINEAAALYRSRQRSNSGGDVINEAAALYRSRQRSDSDSDVINEATRPYKLCQNADSESGEIKIPDMCTGSGELKRQQTDKKVIKILDMCTGSGCIAVSVKKFLDTKGVSSEVTAADISEGALGLAIQNAKNNDAKINFIKSDMFSQIIDTYDIIISNPPYIPISQLRELDKKVLDYEPENALYGGEDGLDFYRIIAHDSIKHLNHGGKLLLEIGYDQGVTVPELLKEAGFVEAEVTKDYCGHDRVVKASWP